mmetsp:Transcript_9107/g.27404  ORF Transcript_9107/g.27404 Transcript_9107/m.27404 type:complete len:380 (+) Transcript_9107:225-1364(+)|eukprot:CAMPEP_0198729688 /NCGR_PEP_ID=MMETSP1475-20131203/20517_1 /TAXON_ID= ORGANISM="Unidentified sp., Strain CCMP1999" /NCGR_SAMPLE_ID=MMETSP1475 /ASSEMBLY_ACC=CAM_ASM_001111 /LENGTH=379 /DNA_ID=CAMNT_0044492389 /DNA_START=182 /DNA_END=1321 /DNA_ORIENTATION=-
MKTAVILAITVLVWVSSGCVGVKLSSVDGEMEKRVADASKVASRTNLPEPVLVGVARQTDDEEGHDEEGHDEHSHSSELEECGTTCRNWKIGFIFIIFSIGLAGGFSPLAVKKTPGSWSRVLSSGLYQFSGGILLAISLLDIVPHAQEELGPKEEDLNGYPLAFTIIAVGFLLDYSIEQIGTHVLAACFGMETHAAAKSTGSEDSNLADEETEGHSAKKTQLNTKSMFATAAIYIALTLHSILAGLSLGISGWLTALSFFIAIVSHKFFASFAAATNLLNGNPSRLVYIAIVSIFALITPIGIAVGMGISAFVNGVATGVLQALSAGMLLYVGTVHTLSESMEKKSTAVYSQIIWYTCGVLLITAITIGLSAGDVLHDH